MQKPIVDLSKHWLAPRPSKNYIFHLLHNHIQAINPKRSLDAGVGELRNFWMFPGRYIGITHNRPAFHRGIARLTTPQPVPDICTPLLTDSAQHPTVFQMRMESDFSFLDAFDLVVCTQTIFYVENRLDALRRLSERVKRGGSLIVDDHIASAADFLAAIKNDYEHVEIIYHGFENCDEMFETMPPRRDMVPEARFMELVYREMTAPNRPEGHDSFYLIARNKKTGAAPPGRMPELMDDNGLFIVRKDIPFLKMEEADANATEVAFKPATPVKTSGAKPVSIGIKTKRPVLHIGPPKTASTTIQEFIIPHLGRPFVIKPAWAKPLAWILDFERPVLAPDVILSDEEFGRFQRIAPSAMGKRLAVVIPGASVIYVRRPARDLFRSYFQQSLINNLAKAAAIERIGLSILPGSPNEFFDLSRELYTQHHTGAFAMADSALVRKAFEPHFTFNILEYEQLQKNPVDFVKAFSDLCESPAPQIDIGKLNLSGAERIDAAIAELAVPVDKKMLDLYRSYYIDYPLSPDRDAFLKTAFV